MLERFADWVTETPPLLIASACLSLAVVLTAITYAFVVAHRRPCDEVPLSYHLTVGKTDVTVIPPHQPSPPCAAHR